MDLFRAFAHFFRRFAVDGLILERAVWSWVMVVGACSRAASYWFRAPLTNTPAAARIEGALDYPTWTVVLLGYAAIIAVGTALRLPRVAWVGHLLGIGAVGTLALSIFFAALLDGAAWSALWPLVVVVLVHWGRANALGPRVAETVLKRREERRE